ncbi:peptidase m16 domain protein [Klebsormidium nitens]|uniref:Peptidase m16 domain protein n=1 Tax=Klebsormidium nitens TaxID=105231 RepID=A0A1Y1I048_KLENI|nr:peptidase m16 domain protein [Klebsormidium nitens]|eukprot:GAQ83813.1 peptidase m16 domain protein [Klebsormidium nitens]
MLSRQACILPITRKVSLNNTKPNKSCIATCSSDAQSQAATTSRPASRGVPPSGAARASLQRLTTGLLTAAIALSALPGPSIASSISIQPIPDPTAQSLKMSSQQLHAGEDFVRGKEAPPLPADFPPLPDVKEPAYTKLVLPNGLRVFLLEDHELGLVGGQLLVKGGTKRVPKDKIGLAAMTANVMRSGGSFDHPADQLDERLERLAAGIEAGASTSTMSLSFGCLAEDLGEVFGLFKEVATNPRLPEDKLKLTREQLLGRIARRNDDPGGIAGREMPKLVYGKDSIYARVADVGTVKAVTRRDVEDFHMANFRPEQGVLGIWGDFSTADVQKLTEQLFGAWKPPTPYLKGTPLQEYLDGEPAANEVGTSEQKRVYLVDKPGLTQGYVRFGELGVTIDDPDVFALDVLNNVLNGFGGRLFNEVRSREGLAYSVSGGWSPAIDHKGLFSGGGETRVDSVAKFIESTQRVLRVATTEEVGPEELSRAKESSLNSFVFNFADSGAQLSRIMTLDLFGVDKDYLFQYKAGVEETTGPSVLAAAQRHLHPDKHKIVVVSDANRARPILEERGWIVEPLEIEY